jgi:hypothetical protein
MSPRRGAVPVAFVGIMFYLVFSMSAVAGGDVAINNTTGDAEFQEMHSNMSTLSEDVMSDVEENSSGYHVQITKSVAQPISSGSERVALWGLEFGYEFPQAARLNGFIAPFLSLGSFGLFTFLRVRRLWRGEMA